MRALLELLVPSVCPLCDAPRAPGETLGCGRTACALPPLRRQGGVRTAFAYRDAGARLIRRFKFERRRDALALVAHRVAERVDGLTFDGIVPLPRHPRRVRELGHDPVWELAREVARLCGAPLWSDVLWRSQRRPPQTGLSLAARWRNPEGSFGAAPGSLVGCRPLLLDDVTTTGATLAWGARALVREAGAALPLRVAAAGTPPAGPALPAPGGLGYNGGPDAVPGVGGSPTMAGTIRMKQAVTLKAQANLGEEVEEIPFEQGEELTVLKDWQNAWLAKNGDGKLFNVKKSLAEPG